MPSPAFQKNPMIPVDTPVTFALELAVEFAVDRLILAHHNIGLFSANSLGNNLPTSSPKPQPIRRLELQAKSPSSRVSPFKGTVLVFEKRQE